jgi:serine/threonine protein kinase
MVKLEERWVLLRKLGQGGQGEVHLGISRDKADPYRAYELLDAGLQNRMINNRVESARKVLQGVRILAGVDNEADLVAIKILRKDVRPDRLASGRARFKVEVEAYQKVQDRHLLRVIESNLEDGWLVSEYQPGGTLSSILETFRGDAYGVVHAIIPVVEAVGRLHEAKVVHRDIKPENIFIGRLGELILGDLGIAYLLDGTGTRVSQTGEKVGTLSFMPPWAMDGLDDVAGNFDVYCLGKTIWAMIAGNNRLKLEYGHKPDQTLPSIFPTYEAMPVVDAFLRKCMCHREDDMVITSVPQMLEELHRLHTILRRGGQRIGRGASTHCLVCGLGNYEELHDLSKAGLQRFSSAEVIALSCDYCGHVQSFANISTKAAWKKTT